MRPRNALTLPKSLRSRGSKVCALPSKCYFHLSPKRYLQIAFDSNQRRRKRRWTFPSTVRYHHKQFPPIFPIDDIYTTPYQDVAILPSSSDTFPFSELPSELGIHIISFSSGLPTLRALSLVSKRTHYLANVAILPSTPILLDTRAQVISFSIMINRHESLALYVHHLWISPPVSPAEDVSICAPIIRACTNLSNLACRVKALQAAILFVTPFLHTRIKHLTIMESVSNLCCVPQTRHMNALETGGSQAVPSADLLLDQITHFRSPVYPRETPQKLRFANLTHWSYRGDKGSFTRGPDIIGEMPALEQVTVTGSHQMWSEDAPKTQLVLPMDITIGDICVRFLSVPKKIKESTLWLEDVNGRCRLWRTDAKSCEAHPRLGGIIQTLDSTLGRRT